jgi:GT2 family glycosyltransferase
VENTARPALDGGRLAALGCRHVVERQVGLDAARNRGAREAVGTIVAYVDDDCVVEAGWLTGLRRGFADPDVALVTGRVLPTTLDLTSQWMFERWCSWDRGELPISLTKHHRLPGFPASPHHLGTGCNMAFRRAALLALGGFDEALDMGSLIGGGGDLDMFNRAIDAGHVAAYEPTALVRHTHRETMTDLRWQMWGYGIAQGALLAKGIATRRGLRRHIAGFWRHRLRWKWRQLRGLEPSGVPRRLVLLETAGIVLGPFLYVPSRAQARLRRRRC